MRFSRRRRGGAPAGDPARPGHPRQPCARSIIQSHFARKLTAFVSKSVGLSPSWSWIPSNSTL